MAGDRVACPYCYEEMWVDAVVCPSCRAYMTKKGMRAVHKDTLAALNYARGTAVATGFLAILVIAALVLAVAGLTRTTTTPTSRFTPVCNSIGGPDC